jgi:hypothetical protein
LALGIDVNTAWRALWWFFAAHGYPFPDADAFNQQLQKVLDLSAHYEFKTSTILYAALGPGGPFLTIPKLPEIFRFRSKGAANDGVRILTYSDTYEGRDVVMWARSAEYEGDRSRPEDTPQPRQEMDAPSAPQQTGKPIQPSELSELVDFIISLSDVPRSLLSGLGGLNNELVDIIRAAFFLNFRAVDRRVVNTADEAILETLSEGFDINTVPKVLAKGFNINIAFDALGWLLYWELNPEPAEPGSDLAGTDALWSQEVLPLLERISRTSPSRSVSTIVHNAAIVILQMALAPGGPFVTSPKLGETFCICYRMDPDFKGIEIITDEGIRAGRDVFMRLRPEMLHMLSKNEANTTSASQQTGEPVQLSVPAQKPSPAFEENPPPKFGRINWQRLQDDQLEIRRRGELPALEVYVDYLTARIKKFFDATVRESNLSNLNKFARNIRSGKGRPWAKGKG